MAQAAKTEIQEREESQKDLSERALRMKNEADGQLRVLDPKWDGRSTFSIPEAAEILGLSRGAGYAAAKAKDLPVVWMGRRGIVPRFRLEKILLG